MPPETKPAVGAVVMPPTPPVATMASSYMTPNLLIAMGFLILGLGAGAAGGYFFGKVDGVAEGIKQTTEQYQTVQAAQQAQQAAIESSYADVQTNPLNDVVTNPFE